MQQTAVYRERQKKKNGMMQLLVHLTSLQMRELNKMKKKIQKQEGTIKELNSTENSTSSFSQAMPHSPIESEIEFTNKILALKLGEASNYGQQRDPRPSSLAKSGTVLSKRSAYSSVYIQTPGEFQSINRKTGSPLPKLQDIHNSSFSSMTSQNTVIEVPIRQALTPSSLGSSSSRYSCSSRTVTPIALSSCTSGHYCGRSAVVVMSYSANDTNEMNLIQDSLITDIEQWGTYWWFGVCGNQEGVFPSTHVILI